jgi:signal transduction histidine kinase
MPKLSTESLLFSALGMSVFECSGRSLCVRGAPPESFEGLFGQWAECITPEKLQAASPFLANFVQEASEFWDAGGPILKSGTWSQRGVDGQERGYEAWAIRVDEQTFVAVKQLDDFAERRAAYQRAREIALSHESLDRKHQALNEINSALEMRNREVERVSQLKDEFLASVSHELRTPLNAIVGFSKLLGEESDGPLNTEQHKQVQHIVKAARHLLALINNILDLSRIEAGHLELHEEPFPFTEALSDALSAIRPQARANHINIVLKVDPDDVIYADKLRLRQVLYNLLHNAAKFTPDFGEVSIECAHTDGWVLITVADNGVGVPASEHSAIFEKFHQARPSVRGIREGTGLGLAITKQIVEGHGGSIRVESVPGNTRFIVKLPWHPTMSRNATVAPEKFQVGPNAV